MEDVTSAATLPRPAAAIRSTDVSTRPPVSTDLPALRLTPGPAPRPLVFGTRGSPLARWQTDHTRALLGGTGTVQVIETRGDRDLDTPLPLIGGKGLFTAELEAAMRDGRIDAAVHSLKDLPVDDPEGLVTVAVLPRHDPRDAMATRHGSFAALPQGARVGTSSRRRAAQLLAARPDLDVVPLRGNVQTRLSRATSGELDAVVLAVAGLERLGLGDQVTERLAVTVMLPAPGQGAVAVQCRADDREAIDFLRQIDHAPTRRATTAERTFLHELGGGCSAAVAALATPLGDTGLLQLTAMVLSHDGAEVIRVDGSHTDPVALGQRLAQRAMDRGAAELLG